MTTNLSKALPPASFSFSLVRDDGGAEGPQGGNGRNECIGCWAGTG